MSSLRGQGEDAYKRKDYKKALELFTRALWRGDTTELLDAVAACHYRLGDLEAALKSAKKTIQVCKADPRGYLRAGRVLFKMDKWTVALEICTSGLRNVKAEGNAYKVLREMHDKLTSKLLPSKSLDPFTMFPAEVVGMILDHLNFRQRINCCRVSTKWAHFVRSSPKLWSTLDFSGARKTVKSAFVTRAIYVGRRKITKAVLAGMQDIDQAVMALTRYCSLVELKVLDVSYDIENLLTNADGGSKLRVLRMQSITSPTLPRLLRYLEVFHCRSLLYTTEEALRWQPMHNLRELAIYDYGLPERLNIQGAFELTPNLQSLTLRLEGIRGLVSDFSMLTNLEHLDLSSNLSEPERLLLPRSIKRLTLDIMQKARRSFEPSSATNSTWVLPVLEELTFTASEQRALGLLEMFGMGLDSGSATPQLVGSHEVKQPSHLRSLLLRSSRAPFHQEGHFNKFSSDPKLAHLEHFAVPEAWEFTDDALQLVVDAFPHLESVDVSSTMITGVGLKHLVQGLVKRRLKRVAVNDCHRLSPDAVDWARAQAIEVDYKMTLSGGERIRYGRAF